MILFALENRFSFLQKRRESFFEVFAFHGNAQDIGLIIQGLGLKVLFLTLFRAGHPICRINFFNTAIDLNIYLIGPCETIYANYKFFLIFNLLLFFCLS